jgi:hypothetical protein
VFVNKVLRRIFISKRVKRQQGGKDCIVRSFIILFLEKSSCRLEDNIKMIIKEVGWDRIQWWALVNTCGFHER